VVAGHPSVVVAVSVASAVVGLVCPVGFLQFEAISPAVVVAVVVCFARGTALVVVRLVADWPRGR